MISEQVLDKLDSGRWCFRGWQFRIRDTPDLIEFGLIVVFN